jgi:hypothetical protein
MRGHDRLRSDAHCLVRGHCRVRARLRHAGTCPTSLRPSPGRPSPGRIRPGCPGHGSSHPGCSRRGHIRRRSYRYPGRSPDLSRGRSPGLSACRHPKWTGHAMTRHHSRRRIRRVRPNSHRGRHRSRVIRHSPGRRRRRPSRRRPSRRPRSHGLDSHRRGRLVLQSGRNRLGVRSRRSFRYYRPGVRARSQRRHAEMHCRLRPLSPTS